MVTPLEAVVDRPQTDPLEVETKRQKEFFEGAYSFIRRDPILTAEEKERRLLKVGELKGWTDEVRTGRKSMVEFWKLQEEKENMPDYLFFAETVEGLTVNWWRLALAQIDPLKFGKGVDRSDRIKATIGKRS